MLLDLSYVSRFWTQFEAWLSMQTCTPDGLRPARPEERRCTVVPIKGANSSMAEGLRLMWSERTPQEAYDLLKESDVTVTNQSDKDAQLRKILSFDERVKDAFRPATDGSSAARQVV